MREVPASPDSSPDNPPTTQTPSSGERVFMTDVRLLKPHPRNTEFFDDITGEKWEDFKNSIRALGVREPLIVTQDQIIVSGHQRVRACLETERYLAPAIQRYYATDKDVIRDLIEINVQQRGVIHSSRKKQAAIITTLEDIYDLSNKGAGRTKKISPNGPILFDLREPISQHNAGDPLSISELQVKLGIPPTTYKRAKALASLIPELQDVAEENDTPMNLLCQIAKRMPRSDQALLVRNLSFFDELTKARVNKELQEALQRSDQSRDEQIVEKDEAQQKLLEEKRLVEKKLADACQRQSKLEQELDQAKALLSDRPQELKEMEQANRQLLEDVVAARNESDALVRQKKALEAQLKKDGEAQKALALFQAATQQIESAIASCNAAIHPASAFTGQFKTVAASLAHKLDDFLKTVE